MVLFRSLFSLTVVLGAVLFQSPARAQNHALEGWQVGAAAGLSQFRQEDGSPPFCCGERDEWSVIGPRFQLMGGWLPHKNFRLALRLDGFYGSSKDGDEERSVTTFAALVGADFRLPLEPAVLHIGLEVGPRRMSGEFRDGVSALESQEAAETDGIVGVHAGADFFVSHHLSLGLDLRHARSLHSPSRADALVTFTWTSGE